MNTIGVCNVNFKIKFEKSVVFLVITHAKKHTKLSTIVI